MLVSVWCGVLFIIICMCWKAAESIKIYSSKLYIMRIIKFMQRTLSQGALLIML